MVASVRHTNFTNTTGAVVAAGGATVEKGQDYAIHTISRTLAVIDVGNAAGKTQDAAGMIFAEFAGVTAKSVVSISIFRAGVLFMAGGNLATTQVAKPAYTITTANGISTVRLIDAATAAGAGLMAAADVVVMAIEVGNS